MAERKTDRPQDLSLHTQIENLKSTHTEKTHLHEDQGVCTIMFILALLKIVKTEDRLSCLNHLWFILGIILKQIKLELHVSTCINENPN